MSLSAEDRLAILDLAARYNQIVDLGGEGWAELFTEHGSFEAGPRPQIDVRGRDQLVEYGSHFVGRRSPLRHWTSNSSIEGDGDQARHTCYLMVTSVDGAPLPALMGVYEDRLVREHDGWKFSERRVTFSSGASPESLARQRDEQQRREQGARSAS